MLTCCPSCGTKFRVVPEHLYAAAGKVRCGYCQQIFDAQRSEVTLGPPILATYANDVTPELKSKWNIFLLLGTLLLFVALPIQWIWWERSWLITVPSIGSMITQSCQYLPCGLQPIRVPEKIEVLQRSLQPDLKNPKIFHFQMRMVNNASQKQPFPLLELRLFNSQSELIGQRRFEPQQYLATKTQDSLMLPGTPIDVALDLFHAQVGVSGFQIDFR